MNTVTNRQTGKTMKNRRPYEMAYLIRYKVNGEMVEQTVTMRRPGAIGQSLEDCEMTGLRQIAFQSGTKQIELHHRDGVDVYTPNKTADRTLGDWLTIRFR